MKNILILSHDPLIERIKQGFVIDDLLEHGFKVQYVDLSKFYFPHFDAPYSLKEDYVIKLDDEEAITSYLSAVDFSSTVVILDAFPNWRSRKIHKFLSNRKADMVKIKIYPNNVLVKESFLNKLKHIGFKNLFPLLCYKIYQRINKINPPKYILSSSSISGFTTPINHPDYEEFIKSGKREGESKDYIVFIDESFPSHPEIKYWKRKNLNSIQDTYRQSLIQLFDYLKDRFNKEVIICAHPKSGYKGDEFGHHKIIKGKTSEIIGQSAFVLMHISTASSYAILHNKPIVLLSSDEYRQNIKSALDYQKSFADILGINIVDIDKWRPQSINDIKTLDENKRQEYIYKFLSPKETASKSNSEIIVNFLDELFFNKKNV